MNIACVWYQSVRLYKLRLSCELLSLDCQHQTHVRQSSLILFIQEFNLLINLC